MRKLTDFEYGVVGSVVAIVADLNWIAFDLIHNGRVDHLFTGAGLAFGLYYSIKAWKQHAKTGKKPVQSNEDIDYRIALYMQTLNFKRMCDKEKLINHSLRRR
jgi:hypothetical protein